MKKIVLLIVLLCGYSRFTQAQDSLKNVHAFAIGSPSSDDLDRFIQFMKEDLGPNDINTLILNVNYNYQYQSYPNLQNEGALSKAQVKQLVEAAREQHIKLIPQINLLGHQSWAGQVGRLLSEFPQFDETPEVAMPEKYEWPNEDSLYCKSYCPLHPEVHKVVFALIDEITEVFETDAFHAGMDEVFYIGKCARCAGKDKAELFANEVTAIRDHLAQSGKRLWIWGDRLLGGKASGLGMWEASENGTEEAINLIPRDVVVCDWHYENAEPTPAIFASKGLDVISCFWNKPDVASAHMQMINFFQHHSNEKMESHFLGTMQTIWSPSGMFLDAYYGKLTNGSSEKEVASFKAMIKYIHENEE